MAELIHEPIDIGRLLGEAARSDCGAINAFLGTTRDHHKGRKVVRLSYQAYEPMALAALEKLETATVERYDVATCRIVHRLGDVPLAEASVAVVIVSAHRAPVFDASRWAMDELKRTVPIWKKEFFQEGGADWIEGTKLG